MPFDLRIEVSANTVNTFGRINGNNIKISDSGTLNADINVIRQQNIYMASGLTVTDTTVNLGKADTNGNIILERSATWEGNIVIQGKATVKIVGEEKIPALTIGQDLEHDTSITVKDNAKFYVLQKGMDAEAVTPGYPTGVIFWNDAFFRLKIMPMWKLRGKKQKTMCMTATVSICTAQIRQPFRFRITHN